MLFMKLNSVAVITKPNYVITITLLPYLVSTTKQAISSLYVPLSPGIKFINNDTLQHIISRIDFYEAI